MVTERYGQVMWWLGSGGKSRNKGLAMSEKAGGD
jgi:hypothetical protein